MEQSKYSRDGESEAERLDRNYGELLQELRVAQTGVQVLFAFLLGIAFTQRFAALQQYQRIFYVITLVAAGCTAILLIAPVSVHRLLFRAHRKDEVVDLTAKLAATGLVLLALSILSAVLFVLDVVLNLAAAIAVTAVLAGVLVLSWVLVPVHRRVPIGD